MIKRALVLVVLLAAPARAATIIPQPESGVRLTSCRVDPTETAHRFHYAMASSVRNDSGRPVAQVATVVFGEDAHGVERVLGGPPPSTPAEHAAFSTDMPRSDHVPVKNFSCAIESVTYVTSSTPYPEWVDNEIAWRAMRDGGPVIRSAAATPDWIRAPWHLALVDKSGSSATIAFNLKDQWPPNYTLVQPGNPQTGSGEIWRVLRIGQNEYYLEARGGCNLYFRFALNEASKSMRGTYAGGSRCSSHLEGTFTGNE